MTTYLKDIAKDVILNIQMKSTDVLITKKGIQITHWESVLGNLSILEPLMGFVNVANHFMTTETKYLDII